MTASIPTFRPRIYALHGRYRYIQPDWHEAINDSALVTPNNWATVEFPQVIIDSDTTQVYRVPTARGNVIFKRYVFTPGGKQYRFRPGRAACEWSGLHALKKAGLPVPDLVAFGEDRQGGRLTGAYIITAEVSGAWDLENYAVQVWYHMREPEKQRVYRQIRQQLFSLIKQAHAHNLFHRDLFWRNILIRQEGEQFRLWFIDCPRLIKTRLRRQHSRMSDLSCLARVALSVMTRSERYRALLAFVDQDRQEARRLFREIQAHHDRSRHPPRIFDPSDVARS